MAPLTPARARLLALMAKHNDHMQIDDALIEKAQEDRISDERMLDAGIEDRDEAEAVQFIFDTNWRAGIPVGARERERGVRVIKAAMKLADLSFEDVVYIDSAVTRYTTHSDEYIVDFSYDALLPLRKKPLIVNLDGFDSHSVSMELIGKIFPRIIASGTMQVQYSFSFGSTQATTSQMGALLYPQVEDSIKRTTWKANQKRSVLAMGVYPGLLNDQDDVPKKISKEYVLKRTEK
jgi:hypothetical protein